MIEIILDNLSYQGKNLKNIYYSFNNGSVLKIENYIYMDEFWPVKKLLENPGFINSFEAYKSEEPGILSISDGRLGYQVIYREKEIINEIISEDGVVIAENDTNEITMYTTSNEIPEGIINNIPTPVLFYTQQGKDLISNFVVVNEKTGSDYFAGIGRQRFKDAGMDFCDSVNKYLKILGFDGEIRGDGSIKKYSGVFLYYTSEGSGFLRLLNILPELDYCKATEKILVVPNYTKSLHPLVIKKFEEILDDLGISAILIKDIY